MTIEVREEASGDIDAIEAITKAAFQNAPYTSHTEHFIVNALREAGELVVSLVAEVNGVVVGHVAISPVSVSDGVRGWFGLGPISVIPEQQGRGIGSLLVREALSHLRARGASGCVVLGEPAFYQRFGFKNESGLVLRDVPPEYFQASVFELPVPHGTVAYSEAFDAQENPNHRA
jgi:putative acetyltransferase